MFLIYYSLLLKSDLVTEISLEGEGRKGKATTTSSGTCSDVQSSKWCNNLRNNCECTCSADCSSCTSGPPATTAAPGKLIKDNDATNKSKWKKFVIELEYEIRFVQPMF